MTQYDVCMIGLGPVGTVSGLCFAKQGFRVVGVDVNERRVEAFRQGTAPFIEPGVDALVTESLSEGTFSATTDAKSAIAASRIIMIAVGTPTPEETGEPDLSYLDAACTTIGDAIRDASHVPVVVVRSTVPPGTMRRRLGPIIEQASGKRMGQGFHIGSNPEFLREGKAIKDFFSTGRIVIGTDTAAAGDAIEALYRDVRGKRLRVSVESAELAKYVDNTWHAAKVTFANEIGRLCQASGGNPDETTRIFLADDQLNISSYYLRPGFAFGGSCLPKDTRGIQALARKHGVSLPMIAGILPSNEAHIDTGVARILAHRPRVVGILGAAFKEHVDDLRESPALMVAAKLLAHGVEVIGHDPHFTPGDALPLPRTQRTLRMATLEDLIAEADTLAQLHNIELYHQVARTAARPVENLTTLTNPDPHGDETDGLRKAG